MCGRAAKLDALRPLALQRRSTATYRRARDPDSLDPIQNKWLRRVARGGAVTALCSPAKRGVCSRTATGAYHTPSLRGRPRACGTDSGHTRAGGALAGHWPLQKDGPGRDIGTSHAGMEIHANTIDERKYERHASQHGYHMGKRDSKTTAQNQIERIRAPERATKDARKRPRAEATDS